MNISSRAVYISLLFHIIFFTSMRLIVYPVQIEKINLMPIDFLGQIIESNLSDNSVPKIPVYFPRPHSTKQNLTITANFDNANNLYSWLDKFPHKGTVSSESKVLGEKIFFLDKLKIELNNTPSAEKKFFIEGPAGNRTLIFCPPLPAFNKRTTDTQLFSSMELKFKVSGEGRTFSIEQVKTSGRAELDLEGIEFIKSLRFMALPKDANASDWGLVILNFKMQ